MGDTLKAMKKKNQMTTEQLARIIQKGFDGIEHRVATKGELESFREDVNNRFEDMDNRFEGVGRRLDSIENEIREIKIVLGPLVRTVAAMEIDLKDLRGRIYRLERKVGIAK